MIGTVFHKNAKNFKKCTVNKSKSVVISLTESMLLVVIKFLILIFLQFSLKDNNT